MCLILVIPIRFFLVYLSQNRLHLPYRWNRDFCLAFPKEPPAHGRKPKAFGIQIGSLGHQTSVLGGWNEIPGRRRQNETQLFYRLDVRTSDNNRDRINTCTIRYLPPQRWHSPRIIPIVADLLAPVIIPNPPKTFMIDANCIIHIGLLQEDVAIHESPIPS